MECLAAPCSAAKLSFGELDVVMKYTFRSLETGKDSPQLLKVECVRACACAHVCARARVCGLEHWLRDALPSARARGCCSGC